MLLINLQLKKSICKIFKTTNIKFKTYEKGVHHKHSCYKMDQQLVWGLMLMRGPKWQRWSITTIILIIGLFKWMKKWWTFTKITFSCRISWMKSRSKVVSIIKPNLRVLISTKHLKARKEEVWITFQRNEKLWELTQKTWS